MGHVSPRGPGAAVGDPDLIARVTPLLRAGGRPLDRVSVVGLVGDVRVEAHYGAQPDTIYEIGSITKTMTALLFAHATESGRLRPDTALGSVLDLADSPVGHVALEELASHRSGLPRIATRRRDRIAGALAVLRHRNPYTAGLATLLEQARATTVANRGRFAYSNLGFALLGQAIAAHAGTTYPQLLQDQLFERLGMIQSTTPLTAAELLPDAPTGYNVRGHSEQAWTMNAYAPAGGVRSTPADMTRYAQAVLNSDAPGMNALDPRWEAENGTHVGYAWFTDHIDDTTITWHNGGTAGFSSMLALDRERASAVVVLTNTAVAVDQIALNLLLNGLPRL